MKFKSKNERLDYLKKHTIMTTCEICDTIYISMTETANTICPFCDRNLYMEELNKIDKPILDYEHDEQILKELRNKTAY